MKQLISIAVILRAAADAIEAAGEAVGVIAALIDRFRTSLGKARADIEATTNPPVNPEDVEPAKPVEEPLK